MSGLAGLLKHGGKPKASKSHENEENIYSKVLKRKLPPENDILYDAELKLFLMDGFVFPVPAFFQLKKSTVQFSHVNRPVMLVLAGHGTQGAWSTRLT